jgi:hypothetical protein
MRRASRHTQRVAKARCFLRHSASLWPFIPQKLHVVTSCLLYVQGVLALAYEVGRSNAMLRSCSTKSSRVDWTTRIPEFI